MHPSCPRAATASTLISIPLGITIGLLASFIQSLGLTIQRKSHVLNQRLPNSQQRVEHRRPLWLLGFTVFISSNVLGSLVQIASLPVVILAPLGAVSLLWNAFFARFLLGDVFSPWMILGTSLIAGGAALIAVFGIVPEPTRSLEDLVELFRRPAFVTYFALLGVFVILSLLTTHVVEYTFRGQLSTSPTLPIVLPATPPVVVGDRPTEAAAVSERTSLLDQKTPLSSLSRPSEANVISVRRTRLLLAISYASFSGILSGMCLLFAKSGVELLLLTIRGMNQFWRWESWVLALGLAVFALLQLWYLHKALILADPTLVCPLAFCFYNMSSIINGLVYFDQFTLISPFHLLLVIAGIVTLLGGVWVVSIQSGEGRVDVGMWAGDDRDIVSEAECEDRTFEGQGGEVAEREGERAGSAVSRGERAKKGSGSEPHMVRSFTSAEMGLGQPSTLQRPNLQATTRFSPTGQSSRSISMTDDIHPHAMQLPSLSMGRKPTSGHSRPLSQVSAIGAGFQIGLSPVSPGFVIIPRDRKKRAGGGMVVGRRRTVSEGDLRKQIEQGELDEDEEGDEAEGSGREGEDVTGNSGWEWWLGHLR